MSRRIRGLSLAGLVLLAGGMACAAAFRVEITRLYHVRMLFDADRIERNFRTMNTMFATAPVVRGPVPHRFARDLRTLPPTYEYGGTQKSIETFLEQSWTTGLIVLKDGSIAFERYFRGNDETSKVIGWSLSKSVVSALVGIAYEEGRIDDLGRAVSDFVPALRGTGYDGVPLRDVLQMASGVSFSEDYGSFLSDINRLGRAIAFGVPMQSVIVSLKREREPGTAHRYKSADTQVLGMVLRAVTGQSIASFSESRLWRKIGMESDAYWLVDRDGVELAFGGLNAVLRDYARLGQLYLNQGGWNGEQIISQSWVAASVQPSKLGFQPGEGNAPWAGGYGYQWWIPEHSEGDYLAVGHSNQFIYVNPAKRIVIAKTSAYPYYTVDGEEKERETIAVFHAIVEHLVHAPSPSTAAPSGTAVGR